MKRDFPWHVFPWTRADFTEAKSIAFLMKIYFLHFLGLWDFMNNAFFQNLISILIKLAIKQIKKNQISYYIIGRGYFSRFLSLRP